MDVSMKPGELRRFRDGLLGSPKVNNGAGRPFMILETGGTETSSWVTFLIEGRIEREWGSVWVEQNSEALNESR